MTLLASTSQAPLNVLVAEDDELQRAYLEAEIARLGCRVEGAADGEEALARLQARRFDVLVTDWEMPRLDGLDLIRRVREEAPAAWLHIIMLTARNAEALTRDALEAGADDFLQKPLDSLQLELAVSSARRVVGLQQRLARRNERLAKAKARTREAFLHIRRDLEAAAELQRRLLPEPGRTGKLRYEWFVRPSLHLGGDTIGVIRTPDDGLLAFQVDVSGHGLPAALGSFLLHNRLMALAPQTPERMLAAAAQLNAEILAQDNGSYATMAMVLIAPGGESACMLRAGHPPPLILRGSGQAEWIDSGGPPLGLFPDNDQPLTPLNFRAQDRLMFYSDGVTDNPDHRGEPLGEAGLRDWLLTRRRSKLANTVTALARDLERYRDGKPPQDDISMLIIEIMTTAAA